MTSVFICVAILGMTGHVLERESRWGHDLAGHMIGLALLPAIRRVPARFLKRSAIPCLLFVLCLLVVVRTTMLGHEAGGAVRWIRIGRLSFQPAELAKPAFVLGMAVASCTASVRMALGVGVLAALSLALVAGQPDFGTAIVLTAIVFAAAYIRGRPWCLLIWPVVILIGASALASPHVLSRISAFVSAEKDLLGRGYQINQSLQTLTASGLWRCDRDTRHRLPPIPSATRDFVLPTYAYRFGSLPVLSALVLLSVGLLVSMKRTLYDGSAFAVHMKVGALCSLYLQMAINLMSTLGLAPIVGIPFPFLSAGGSSTVTSWILVGFFSRSYGEDS